mgnify:CR=1 FL=1
MKQGFGGQEHRCFFWKSCLVWILLNRNACIAMTTFMSQLYCILCEMTCWNLTLSFSVIKLLALVHPKWPHFTSCILVDRSIRCVNQEASIHYSCVLLLLYYCCTKLLLYYCCVIFFLVIVIQDLASFPFFDNRNELGSILLHILINYLHNRYANLFSRYQM